VGLIKMHKATDAAGDSAAGAKPDVSGLADTLNQLTGATTKSTRAWVLDSLEKSKAIDAGAELGLTTRDLINAAMGQTDAYVKVRGAVKAATLASVQVMGATGAVTRTNQKAYDAATTLTGSISGLGQSLKSTRADVRATAIASEDLASVYRVFPKRVATQIDATGIVPTARGVAELAVKYDAVDKRHLNALIKATGADISARQVQNLIDKINALHDKTVVVHYRSDRTGTGINAAEQSVGGSPRKAGKVVNLDDYRKMLGGLDPRTAEMAGNALLQGIVKGIKKGQRDLKHVMDGLRSYIKSKNDSLQALLRGQVVVCLFVPGLVQRVHLLGAEHRRGRQPDRPDAGVAEAVRAAAERQRARARGEHQVAVGEGAESGLHQPAGRAGLLWRGADRGTGDGHPAGHRRS
jgi:hypothetical protein